MCLHFCYTVKRKTSVYLCIPDSFQYVYYNWDLDPKPTRKPISGFCGCQLTVCKSSYYINGLCIYHSNVHKTFLGSDRKLSAHFQKERQGGELKNICLYSFSAWESLKQQLLPIPSTVKVCRVSVITLWGELWYL